MQINRGNAAGNHKKKSTTAGTGGASEKPVVDPTNNIDNCTKK